MSSSCSSSETVPTKVDGYVVASSRPKNEFRKPKKIPYTMPIYEPSMPSWFNCEYSSTPSILGTKDEVIYPREIDIVVSYMSNVHKCKLARTKTIMAAEDYSRAHGRRILNR